MTPAFSYGDFERQFTSATVNDLTGPDKFRLWLILAGLPCEARTHRTAELLAYGLTYGIVDSLVRGLVHETARHAVAGT